MKNHLALTREPYMPVGVKPQPPHLLTLSRMQGSFLTPLVGTYARCGPENKTGVRPAVMALAVEQATPLPFIVRGHERGSGSPSRSERRKADP